MKPTSQLDYERETVWLTNGELSFTFLDGYVHRIFFGS